ncbi:Hypothetical predicted protein [Lecanosticta acicola]|uniref:Uncharacterized protein n=1 Tax=Lecanosticta acicola TaxID=111012 RepID=A0AAI8Z371_9PEZI|nr:Hypothetical predicted protein [Lecanosticta acicola]
MTAVAKNGSSENQTLPRGLPIELYQHILSYIAPEHDSTLHIDKAIIKRQFLSVESLPPPAPTREFRDSIVDVGHFRRSCKRFADIGAPYIFTQVAIRFSEKGLQRLDDLARWRNVARHVKRFSYLVPYFFEGGLNNLDEIKEELRELGLRPSDLGNLRRKAYEQRSIIAGEHDVHVLKRAIASFSSLQLIQILRVSEREDEMVLQYLRGHAEARTTVNLDWTSACRHASHTIGVALLASNNVQPNRFSLPMASPSSARFLQVAGPNGISTLAERLTCLTLHFDDGDDLDTKIMELSDLFKTVFSRAKRMKAVHIGFPSHRPLTLPLASVFHHVAWDDLIAFGIQGWELDSEEIVEFLQRHATKLRGVRLRDVHLKEGSQWKDVLSFLRDEMRQLLWVSLRRIGYTAFFHSPEYSQYAGAEVPPLDGDSEEDENEEDEQYADGPSTHVDSAPSDDEIDHSEDDSDEQHDSDDEHGPDAHEMEFPNLNSPDTPASAPWCNCGGPGYLDLSDDLADDDVRIDNAKRKRWERWVLKRCPEHGER